MQREIYIRSSSVYLKYLSNCTTGKYWATQPNVKTFTIYLDFLSFNILPTLPFTLYY